MILGSCLLLDKIKSVYYFCFLTTNNQILILLQLKSLSDCGTRESFKDVQTDASSLVVLGDLLVKVSVHGIMAFSWFALCLFTLWVDVELYQYVRPPRGGVPWRHEVRCPSKNRERSTTPVVRCHAREAMTR